MKKLIAMLVTICFLLGQITAFAYIEKQKDSNYVLNLNFEDRDTGSLSGNPKITEIDGNACMEVSGKTNSLAASHGIDVSLKGIVCIEFSIKGGARPALYVDMDGAGLTELFEFTYNGWGAFLRDKNNVSHFVFGPNDVPSYQKWNHFKLIYDTVEGTIRVFGNGTEQDINIWGLSDNRKVETNVKAEFKTGTINRIAFGTATSNTNTDTNYFDNIKIYLEKSKAEEQAPVDTMYQQNFSKLSYLGVFGKQKIEDLPLKNELTREEFLLYAMRLIKLDPNSGNRNAYQDISPDSEIAGYAGYAKQMGIISDGDTFSPKEKITLNEALKIVTGICNYTQIAESRGGYPVGYYATDIAKDLLSDITVKDGRQMVRMKDAVLLFTNALYVTLPTEILKTDHKLSFSISGKDGKTLLSQYYHLEQRDMEITNIDYSAKRIFAKDLSTGEEKTFDTEELSLLNLKDTYRSLWINDDDTVVYSFPYSLSEVIYGYITSYNNDKIQDPISPDKVNSIKLSTYDGFLPTASNFQITQNGIALTNARNVSNLFGKAVFVDEEIVRFEVLCDDTAGVIYEGGILVEYLDDSVVFNRGESQRLSVDDLEDYTEIITILNGREISYDQLAAGMIIDYFVHENYLYILASDSSVTGTFEEIVDDDQVIIFGKTLNLSPVSVYTSENEGETYSSELKLKEYLGSETTVYLDLCGNIKYMDIVTPSVLYAAISGGKYQKLSDIGELEVYVINGKILEKKIYQYPKVSQKQTVFYPEVTFYEAASHAKDLDGSCVYRLVVNGSTIRKIEAVEWANNGKAYTVSSFASTMNRIKVSNLSRGLYFDDRILVLDNEKGEFAPELVPYSSLKSKRAVGALALLEASMPVSKLLVLTNFKQKAANTLSVGVVKSKSKILVSDTPYYNYVIVGTDGTLNIQVEQEQDWLVGGKRADVSSLVIYRKDGLNPSQGGVIVDGIIPFAEIPWNDATYSSSYTDVNQTYSLYAGGTLLGIEKNFLRVLRNETEEYFKPLDSCRYFSLVSGHNKMQVIETELGKLVGDQIVIFGHSGDVCTFVLSLAH